MGDPKQKSTWENMQDLAAEAFGGEPESTLTPEQKAANARRLAPKNSNVQKYGVQKAFGPKDPNNE